MARKINEGDYRSYYEESDSPFDKRKKEYAQVQTIRKDQDGQIMTINILSSGEIITVNEGTLHPITMTEELLLASGFVLMNPGGQFSYFQLGACEVFRIAFIPPTSVIFNGGVTKLFGMSDFYLAKKPIKEFDRAVYEVARGFDLDALERDNTLIYDFNDLLPILTKKIFFFNPKDFLLKYKG